MKQYNPSEDLSGYEEEFGYPNEPSVFSGQLFDMLLEFCAKNDASDVTVQTELPIYAHIQGRNVRVTKRSLTSNEVDGITNYIYGSNGTSQLRKGEDIDTRHMVVRRERNAVGSMITVSKIGFRVNITACWSMGDENGIQITARSIKSLPPSLADIAIEQEIIDALYPEQGLVAVCGPTGSGKSTLLAATMRYMIEKPDSHKKIITLEAPIEYVYDDLPRASAIISQHEIPRHIPSFPRGVRNSLRRAPKVILVGETRDMETAQASLEASQTGHVVYTTIHSNSVPSTLSRVANMFAPSERMTKVFELAESLRLVIVQRLVRRADGVGRIALREFLIFDQSVRDQLRMATSLREAEHLLAKLVERKGQTMLSCAQTAFDKGHISADQLVIIENEYKSNLIDDLGLDI